MKSMLVIAYKSLNNRRSTTLLTILTVAMSIFMLLGVEKIRVQAKQSFANTISNTDLIVGARSGQINLLLYSLFRIGSPTANISWESYKKIISNPNIAWSIPISLGDSHRGFRVLGTTENYFKHYQFGRKQHLSFLNGEPFSKHFSTVIGAQVAKELNYKVGDSIVIAHGIIDQSFNRHKNSPFKISGILAPTGTPVDRTVHVTLAAIDTIHSGKQFNSNQKASDPKQITAFMLGLHSKVKIFAIQREINTQKTEPLSAILPGIALYELWSMMAIAEQALLAVSVFVVIAGLLGVLSSLLTSLQYRSREIAILRAMGARPKHIIGLLLSEASLIGFLGIIFGVATLYLAIACFAPYILSEFGIHITLDFLSYKELLMLAAVQFASVVVGFIPAISAYSQSLSDGMTVRT
jgi:putative ABC transport system permease protein